MSAPIFYISTEEYDALTPGAVHALGGSEGKHALVKRLELGERIDLGDGTGRRALGTVASINADGVSVQVQELREERSVPSIYLVQALAKAGRDPPPRRVPPAKAPAPPPLPGTPERLGQHN